MAHIAVIGGTGFAGSHIVQEAVDRGHTVLSIARKVPAQRIEGATYLEGTILDVPALVREIEGVDVVVSALSPRGDMAGLVRPNLAELFAALPDTVRLGVIGGAGGSLVSEGGPRLIDCGFPEAFKAEAEEAIGELEDLQASGRTNWFFVHPAAEFGARTPGERTGHYRTGGDVLVTDAEGKSSISGADLAVAVVDEIENPQHEGQRFTVGY